MTLDDRDYMREEPDEESVERYEEEQLKAEYGEVGAGHRGVVRWIIVVIGIGLLLLVLAAIFGI